MKISENIENLNLLKILFRMLFKIFSSALSCDSMMFVIDANKGFDGHAARGRCVWRTHRFERLPRPGVPDAEANATPNATPNHTPPNTEPDVADRDIIYGFRATV